MRMAFALHPDDTALSRSRLLVRPAGTRPKSRPLRLVWHDTANRDLRAEGLTLEEQRGLWSLQRLMRDGPSSEPALLATSRRRDDLPLPTPEALAPIATFEGRQTSFSVTRGEGETLALTLLRGSTNQKPIARLILSGPDALVRDLALALAATFRLTIPNASLASEAIASSEETDPPPRHLGPPAPATAASVAVAFAQALGQLTDVLLHFAPIAAAGGADPEPVHQMRVAVRRARSTIQAVRGALDGPTLAAADRDLKALGAVLGPTRDWDVLVTETLPRVAAALPDDARLPRLAKAAQVRRAHHQAALAAYLDSPALRQLGIALAWLCASDAWHAELAPAQREASTLPPASFAAPVLQRRWKKLRAAGKHLATLDAADLHAVRLRTKRARYAMEVFRPATDDKQADRLLRRLATLQQRLGTLNDGAVAGALLAELGGARGRHGYAIGLVLGFLAAAAAAARPGITRAGRKFRGAARFWA